jgi:hypothetical protein
MPFEKVESSGRGAGAQPKISLRKSGSIGVNNSALEEYFEEGEEYVELYYDAEENRLGLLGLEEESESSFTLSRSDSGGSVTPMSFLRGEGLIPDVTTQYSPDTQKLNGDTELVVIDLDDPIGTYGSADNDSEEDSEE